MNAHQRALSLHGADDGPLAAAAGPGSTGVALFHGFTSGPVSVTGWARALAAAGAHVEVPLLPGHGTRWQDLEDVTADDWRATARVTVDRLLAVHDRVIVGGLSMGGALALDAAAHRPVSGAVVVNPGLRFASLLAPLAGLLKFAVRSVAPIANDAARPGVDEQAYPRTPVAAVQQVGALQSTARAGLPRIQAPVLAFRSSTDHVVPRSSMDVLGRGLAAGLLTVRPLYNSYHVATLDWDAGVIEDETVRFIAPLVPRRVRVHG
ncbi:MAG: alpha/beta fold hydrolase [Micrococcus sp.]|nr:alpha/beta fold hydrolase [Micrococcus sp.]